MADDREHEGGEVVRVDFGKGVHRSSEPEPPLDDDERAANRAKLEAFTAMIDKGMVLVTVDSRRPGVVVPEHLSGEVQLGLNFSHKFYIDDFDYDEGGVRASLTFQGTPAFCDLPWTAVWMMRSHVDGELVLMPESVPDELKAALSQAAAELEAASEAAEAAGHEEASPDNGDDVDGREDREDGEDGDGDGGGDGDGDDDPPSRGGLRLIK